MTWQPLDLPDADVRLHAGWMAPVEADRLLDECAAGLPWTVHRVRLFGREQPSPRLSCWLGDPGAVYRYSGSRHVPHPWTPGLARLRDRLQALLGCPFNSLLANLYRDGNDAMGLHSDDEPELGRLPVIASLSLGGTRRFRLKHRETPVIQCTLQLRHGDLLVMAGSTQRNYRHALPRTARPVAPRVNLTFRHVACA